MLKTWSENKKDNNALLLLEVVVERHGDGLGLHGLAGLLVHVGDLSKVNKMEHEVRRAKGRRRVHTQEPRQSCKKES